MKGYILSELTQRLRSSTESSSFLGLKLFTASYFKTSAPSKRTSAIFIFEFERAAAFFFAH